VEAIARYLTVSQGNLNNNHLYLTEILDLFPRDVFGGGNRRLAAPRALRIFWGSEMVETDIDQTKHIFRKRGWVAQFFDANRIQAGDSIVLEQLAPYLYRVAKAEDPGEPGLDAGITSWFNSEVDDLL